MQVFVKNNNRWEGKPHTPDDIANYKTASAKSTIAPVFAHAAYLINLCAVERSLLAKSRAGFEDELRRCEGLGIAGLIVHPGAHMGAGEQDGMKRIAESLNIAHGRTKGFATASILETTAGQGTALGWRFEQLRGIIDLLSNPDRVRICIDTAHLFAAGYPIHTEEGWEQTMKELETLIGLDRLAAVHTNDSRKEFGSRVDRHDHIGRGKIGLTCFRSLMNDPRLADIPKILETEKSEDMHEDVENMDLLKSLIGSPRAEVKD
jgi:deoxyribonuclease IV